MKKQIFQLLALVSAAIALAGCSQYTKLLKSQDYELKYRKGLDYYNARKYQKALQLFEDVAPYLAGTVKDDSIKFYTAASYYNQGDFEMSGIMFENFRRSFARTSPFIEEVEYMYAMGYYYSSPKPERDQANTLKAMSAIAEYLDRYPNSVKKDALNVCMAELRNKMYDKEYLNAKCYYTIGKHKAAVVALRNALDDSPENPHREEMMYLTAKSGYMLAHNSVSDLQRDRYLKMMDYYFNFASEYPDSKYSRELGKMMEEARTYLQKTDPANKTTGDGQAAAKDKKNKSHDGTKEE